MRKKFLLFLSLIFTCAIALGLVSCDDGNGGDNHNHELTHISETSPSCTENGTVEHWLCNACGKIFSDELAANEITNTVLPAHHTLVFNPQITPTCTEDGFKSYWKCSACSTKFSDESAGKIAYNVWIPATHSFVDGTCESCQANGTPELIYELCGDTYTVTGVSNRNLLEIIIPATHNEKPVVAIAGGAFDNCKSLRSIEIGENITELAESFLDGCDKLVEIVNRTEMSSISTTLPNSVEWSSNEESGLEISDGYLFYVESDNKSYLIDYLGSDSDLVLPENFVIEEKYRILLPVMLLAEDFEQSILIPLLERFALAMEEYCSEKYSDVNFSFFDNPSYAAYEYECISYTEARKYLSDMKAVYQSAFKITSPEYKQLNAFSTDINRIMAAYSAKIPAKYINASNNDALEAMYKEYPITKSGKAIYVYAGSETSAVKRAVESIIKEACPNYSFSFMYEQEKACGFDRFSNDYYSGYTVIGKAFYGRDDITSVTVIDGAKHIGFMAFAYCKNLKSVAINCGTIDIGAFAACENLESVTLNIALTADTISPDSFIDCKKLKTLTIGKDVEEIDPYRSTYYLTIENIEVDSGNQNYLSIDGNLYSSDAKTIIRYAPGKANESFTLPSTVETVGKYAFYNCISLTSIVIPDSVEALERFAFLDCTELKSIFIPASVKVIKSGAFAGCENVTITVDSENAVYHTDGNCLIITDKKMLIFGNKNSVIPNDGSVTVIVSYAFAHSELLTEITIPGSVKFIMYSAFYDSVNLINIKFDLEYPFYLVELIYEIVDGDYVESYRAGHAFNNVYMLDLLDLNSLCRDFDNINSYMQMARDWYMQNKT